MTEVGEWGEWAEAEEGTVPMGVPAEHDPDLPVDAPRPDLPDFADDSPLPNPRRGSRGKTLCAFVYPGGRECKGWTSKGSRYCYSHWLKNRSLKPPKAKYMQRMEAREAARIAELNTPPPPPIALRNRKDALDWNEWLANELRAGKMEAARAQAMRACIDLAAEMSAAIEVEKRVDAVEKQLKRLDRAPG